MDVTATSTRSGEALTRRLGPLTVRQIPCLSDNYAFLLRDEGSGTVALVDTPEAEPIAAELDRLGWTPRLILNTHWHPDHTGGNEAIKARYGCEVVGPAGEADRIPGIDRMVGGGDRLRVGGLDAAVLDVPGHTNGHVAFHLSQANAAFVGDALFSLGCGRMFEGTPEGYWRSMTTLRALPPDTWLFCAHEYTGANARFALSVDPDNEVLQLRAQEVRGQRARGEATVPVTLEAELAANPFLRADDPVVARAVGAEPSDPVAAFGRLRAAKDQF